MITPHHQTIVRYTDPVTGDEFFASLNTEFIPNAHDELLQAPHGSRDLRMMTWSNFVIRATEADIRKCRFDVVFLFSDRWFELVERLRNVQDN